VRSSGKRGLLEVFRYACPRLTLFAPSRSRALRKLPTAIFGGRSSKSCAPDICRNGCAEMQRGGAHGIFPRRAPFGRKESQPWAGVPPDAVRPRVPEDRTARLRRHDPQLRSRFGAIAGCPGVEKIARLGVLVLAQPWEWALFSQQQPMGTRCVASTRGPCGAGGRAFRGLTRSATEWSAARRKPLRAAAMHLSAAISADVRPVGFRRANAENFRPRKFSKRARLEGAERVNPRKARLLPTPSPFVTTK
jgi:hypothetical protein